MVSAAMKPGRSNWPGLAHPVRAADRLLLGARIELRLHQDDHGSGLEIQSHTADVDLHDHCGEAVRFLGPRSDLRALAEGYVTVNFRGSFSRDRAAQCQDLAELAEDQDLLAPIPAFLNDLLEPLYLRKTRP